MEDTFMNTKIIKIRALLDVVHGLLIDIDDEIKDMRWYTTNKNVKANPWKIDRKSTRRTPVTATSRMPSSA